MTGMARALGPLTTLLLAVSLLGFVVVVDPGHDAVQPGAISARGKPEVEWNDAAAAALAGELRRVPGLEVVQSRGPGEHLGLDERIRRIRKLNPDLVISLHHDSVQPQYLSSWTVGGRKARFCDAFAGFSLFVPGQGAHAARSLTLAREIGVRLREAGFAFSTHHGMKVPGEGRKLLDPDSGVYDGGFLRLLREAPAPAVLLERGVLVHREEELRLSDPAVLGRQVAVVAAAVAGFLGTHPPPAGKH